MREGNRHLIDRHLIPFFGNMRVPEIGRADVRRYKTTPRERFLSTDELKRLGFVLDHADDRQAAAAIRLLLFTGARSSEITGLRWDWIRDTRAVLPDSKTGPKAIQLPPPARAVLNGLPREGRFVFPNRTGDLPMKDLGLRWQKLRGLAGIDDVRIHDCRHTFASHAVMSGLDLYTVGRLLGHADVASTERYAHLARLWGGEDVKPPRKNKAPLFRDFAAHYRARREYRWKPSSLKTFDIYLRNRLMPHFGRLRLDAIDHVRVLAWFDAASTDKPGAANRAFEILRAMLASARQWGDLGEHVPDACANIVRNPHRPDARYLDREELKRLGAALDRRREEHP